MARPADFENIGPIVTEVRRRLIVAKQPIRARFIEVIYRNRRIRDALFGHDALIFGEPAWDIMLDLYMANLAERPLSVSSACIGANVPTTTAMRHLAILESHALIERTRDENDGRRSFVTLTERARRLMDLWIERALPAVAAMTSDD